MSQASADSANNDTTAVEEASAPVTESIQETTTTEAGNNQGQGGSGEEVTAQAEAATESQQPTLESKIASATGVDEYEALMREVQSNPTAFQNPTQEAATQEGDGQSQQQSAAQSDAPPEGAEGEQAEGAAEGDGIDPDGEEGDQGSEGSDNNDRHPQFRLRPTQEVDAEALRIMKAAEVADAPISLSEALGIAESRLGIKKPDQKPQSESTQNQGQAPDNQGDTDEGADDPTSNITLSEAKQELKDLRKAHSQALRDGDLDEAADVMDKISETEDLIEVVAKRESTESQKSQQAHETQFRESLEKTNGLYPDFQKADSEFFERAKEIDETLRDTQDPRYNDPNKPLLIAQMVAKEMNIAPSSKKKASQPPAAAVQTTTQQPAQSQQPNKATTSPQPPRIEKPGQLPAASGASRTQGAPTGAATSLAEQVASISGPEEFEQLARAVHSANR